MTTGCLLLKFKHKAATVKWQLCSQWNGVDGNVNNTVTNSLPLYRHKT